MVVGTPTRTTASSTPTSCRPPTAPSCPTTTEPRTPRSAACWRRCPRRSSSGTGSARRRSSRSSTRWKRGSCERRPSTRTPARRGPGRGHVDDQERLAVDHLERVGALRGLIGTTRGDDLDVRLAPPQLIRPQLRLGEVVQLHVVGDRVRDFAAAPVAWFFGPAAPVPPAQHLVVRDVGDDLDFGRRHPWCSCSTVVLALGPRVHAERSTADDVERRLAVRSAGCLRQRGGRPQAEPLRLGTGALPLHGRRRGGRRHRTQRGHQ